MSGTVGYGAQLLSVREFCRRAGISYGLGLRAVRHGWVPSIQLGARRFVSAAVLDRLLHGAWQGSAVAISDDSDQVADSSDLY